MNKSTMDDLKKSVLLSVLIYFLSRVPFVEKTMVYAVITCYFLGSIARRFINKKSNYWIPFVCTILILVLMFLHPIATKLARNFLKQFH